MSSAPPPSPPARGILLVEALVALAVLLLGGMVLWRAQARLPQELAQARQWADAARRLQAQAEADRGFVSLRPHPSAPAGLAWTERGARAAAPWTDGDLAAGAPPPPGGTQAEGLDADWTLDTLAHAAGPGWLALRHRLRWTDARGARREATLDHALAAVDPVLAALAPVLDRADLGFEAPGRRARGVPATARDAGDGTLVWRPVPGRPDVWRMDARSGEVTATCQADPALDDGRPQPTDLVNCVRLRGLALSGTVRFATRTLRPDAAAARDPRDRAAALDACLHEGDGVCLGPPRVQCLDDAPAAGVPDARTASPDDPLPDPSGATAEGPAVRYACLVLGRGDPPRWSGRLDLAPVGWALGETPGTWRVCRYSADHDGDGRIGATEHPAAWRDVGHPLTQQNFLVVRGEAACPAAPPSPDNPVDAGTVPHQPP
jgi:hypothetical protein